MGSWVFFIWVSRTWESASGCWIVAVERNWDSITIKIHRSKYIHDMLSRSDMVLQYQCSAAVPSVGNDPRSSEPYSDPSGYRSRLEWRAIG